MREHGGCHEARFDGAPIRVRRSIGRPPMIGGFARDSRGSARSEVGTGFERSGEPPVEAAPLTRRQVRDDRLGEETVSEAVARRTGKEDLSDNRVPDRFEVVLLDSTEDSGHQPLVERSRGDRRDLEDLDASGRERPDLGTQRIREDRRERGRSGANGRQQLLVEERIAFGPQMDLRDESRLWSRVEDRQQLRRRLVGREGFELDDPGARTSAQLRQPGRMRVRAGQMLSPRGEDEEHPLRPEVSGEKGDQVPRRGIDPVDVLEHHHRGSLIPQPTDHAEQVLEESNLRSTRVEVDGFRTLLTPCGRRDRGRAELGDQPSELPASRSEDLGDALWRGRSGEVAQGRRQGTEGKPATHQLEAVPHQDRRPERSRPGGELCNQPALADAGGPGHHDERRFAGRRPGEGVRQGRPAPGCARRSAGWRPPCPSGKYVALLLGMASPGLPTGTRQSLRIVDAMGLG